MLWLFTVNSGTEKSIFFNINLLFLTGAEKNWRGGGMGLRGVDGMVMGVSIKMEGGKGEPCEEQ
jgi:hypothetical protein